MLTLLFGVNAQISGWATAIFLAILLVVGLGKSRLYQSFIETKETATQNRFFKVCIRWTVHVLVVGVLSAVLAVVLGLEPAPNSSLTAIIRQKHANFWQGEKSLVLDDLEVTFIVLSLIGLTAAANRLSASLYRRIKDWEHYHFRTVRIQELSLVTRAQIGNALAQAVRTTRSGILFLAVSTGLLLILSLYSLTGGVSQAVGAKVFELWESAQEVIQSFLPNLLMLVAIGLLTRLIFKAMSFFYDAIWKGKIRVNKLHHELVEPTYQLLRLLVIAFALVAAFPYIPGSSSPVFKAISIFIGFLLSLGSTSLASNVVSGIVLTYTRGLRIGDRVQVADAVGDVIDRTLLVTRVRTIKNVVITLPNSMVMQNKVNNYSAEAQNNSLILHTSVTIGYDVPWRRVDHLLIEAAQKTPDILDQPPPFVLKTSLDDFYISYELNAYTDRADRMALTYSTLHENILDEFQHGGVEIMSPSYFAIRDGQETTIPKKEGILEPDREKRNGSYRS